MAMQVESCTELDSPANMPVVGKPAYIIAETSKKVDVSPFTPDYKLLTVPLVDAMVKYDNPYNRNHTYWYYVMHFVFRRWIITSSHHSC